MIVYGLKNCDSCRKALKALPAAELVDVRAEGVPAEVLQKAFAHFESKLLNTRSTTWRQLDEGERGQDPLTLIKTHPTLMKRPLIVDGDQMVLGFDKAAQAALGLG